MSRRAPLSSRKRAMSRRPMCAAAEAGLPVSRAPVPGGVHESGLLGEERSDNLEVAVRVGDEGLNRLTVEPRRRVAHTRARSAAARPARRPKTTHSRSELPIMRFLPWAPPPTPPQAKTTPAVGRAAPPV